jgi:hypothetical protein
MSPSNGSHRSIIRGSAKGKRWKKGGGSIRRFAHILRQLDLTFDPELMPLGGLSAVLPVEFDGWKKSVATAALSSSTAAVLTTAP